MSKLNILVAYPYFSNPLIQELAKKDSNSYNLIVDSGAFSVYNSGHEIKLKDYCDFIKKLPFKSDYVQLDVVFNEQKTKNNYKEMLNMGFNPCPVYTRGSSPEYLDELIEENKYIFIGGVQGGKEAKPFAKYVLERTKGKKIHYLAFVRSEWLKYYRPYSVDSSTWTSGARFGLIKIYDGMGNIKSIKREVFHKQPPLETIELLKNCGITYKMLKKLQYKDSWICNGNSSFDCSSDKAEKGFAFFLSVIGYVKYMLEIEKKIGTKVYLAVGDKNQLNAIFKANEFLKTGNL